MNWSKIHEGIEANMDILPDLYEYKETRLLSQFRRDLCTFARQLMLANPQNSISASNLIQQHSVELEYLVDLIKWRLDMRKQEPNEWNADNPFYWRFAFQGTGVPPETEERVAGFYERGEYDRAEILFQFLADCFDDYAEGYNYLGLMSLDREKLDEAIDHFQKAMDLGRKKFPKRMPRNRYWNDLSTRPYIRAMRNLTLALSRVGRYEEALRFCERLDQECGDDISPLAYRASIYLNTGRWQEAADSASRLHKIDASESIVAALAFFEMGRLDDAASFFLHGALNFPRAAKMVAGLRTSSPKNHEESRDHNAGVDILRNLDRYLQGAGRKSRRSFKRLVEDPEVGALLTEMESVKKRWYEQHRTGDREAFDRMHIMQAPEFARSKAARLAGVLRP
jgi:tetratricopeptide (TPR) repeat protein